MTTNLILNKVEAAVLKAAVRRGDSDHDFMELLLTLDSLCDASSGGMYISQNTLEQLWRFGLDSRNPRWQAMLFTIFRRTLGDNLGRERDESGKLLEREKSKNP